MDMLKVWISKLERRDRICLVTGLVTGLVTHLMMLTNKITNLDDIVCVPDVGGGAVLGRYLQMPVHMLFSEWSAPALNGMMAILLLTITCCILLHLLRLNSDTAAVLVPFLMLTGPSVASNMYYMYLAPTFAVAILLSVATVAITEWGGRFGWIPGFCLLIISMACYQAYFALCATVFLLAFAMALIDGKEPREVIIRGLRALLVLGLAMAGYLLSLRLLPIELSDYKGLDSIGDTTLISRMHSVLRTWHRVLQYFVTQPESYNVGAPILWMRMLSLCLVILFIILIVQRRMVQSRTRLLLLLFVLALLPCAMGLTYVMAPEVSHASTVMTFSYIGFDLLLVAFLERIRVSALRAEGKGPATVRRQALTAFLTATVLLLIARGYTDYRLVNNAYYRSHLAQIRMEQFYGRIMERLESEGYVAGEPVMIVGQYDPEPLPTQQLNMGGEIYEDFEGMTLEAHLFLPTIRSFMLRRFLGMGITVWGQEEMETMEARQEVQAMPVYPAQGCVSRIDGVWVLRVGQEEAR